MTLQISFFCYAGAYGTGASSYDGKIYNTGIAKNFREPKFLRTKKPMMSNLLEEILKTGHVKSENGELIDASSGISDEKGQFLQKLIRELKPISTLEVGLAFGISALFICEAIQKTDNARHIMIDPYQYRQDVWRGIGIDNIRKSGFEDLVEFYDIPSYQALSQLAAQGREIDFAFIDGMHLFDYALVDFFLIDKILKIGGVVVFDDADLQSIRKLCRFVVKNRSYSVYKCLINITHPKLSIKRVILKKALKIPIACAKIHKYLSSETIENDLELNLNSSMIAFRKEADDTRRWDFHERF